MGVCFSSLRCPMSSIFRATVAAVLLAPLALAGCSGGGEAGPRTLTTTVPAPADPSAESHQPALRTAEKTPAEVTRTAAPAAPAAQPHSNNVAANPEQIGGYCGMTSDGAEVDADDDASCAFAMAIYDAAIAQAYESRTGASGNTVLATVNDFKVTSPVTEQTYTLGCFVGTSGQALICYQPSSAYGNSGGANFNREKTGWHSILG